MGSFDSRIPMVLVNSCWRSVVFQFGTFVLMECSSSSIFILASKRLYVTSDAIVLFIDIYTDFLIVFLMIT